MRIKQTQGKLNPALLLNYVLLDLSKFCWRRRRREISGRSRQRRREVVAGERGKRPEQTKEEVKAGKRGESFAGEGGSSLLEEEERVLVLVM